MFFLLLAEMLNTLDLVDLSLCHNTCTSVPKNLHLSCMRHSPDSLNPTTNLQILISERIVKQMAKISKALFC